MHFAEKESISCDFEDPYICGYDTWDMSKGFPRSWSWVQAYDVDMTDYKNSSIGKDTCQQSFGPDTEHNIAINQQQQLQQQQ